MELAGPQFVWVTSPTHFDALAPTYTSKHTYIINKASSSTLSHPEVKINNASFGYEGSKLTESEPESHKTQTMLTSLNCVTPHQSKILTKNVSWVVTYINELTKKTYPYLVGNPNICLGYLLG